MRRYFVADCIALGSFAIDSLKPSTVRSISRFRKEESLRTVSIAACAEFNAIMVITLKSHNVGFFGYLLFALNQLSLCERNGYFPVVYFGKRAGSGRNDFYDLRFGSNMWNYYFEPVAGLTYEDVRAAVPGKLFELTADELHHLHFQDPESVFPYPYGVYFAKADYDPDWYRLQRSKGAALIKKYVKIKSHIREEIDKFHGRHMSGRFVIGVHVRGTDKATNVANPRAMRIIEPQDYFDRIDPMLSAHPDARIFVATDQAQYLEMFKHRYEGRIVCYNSVRSRTDKNVFQKRSLNGYRLGKDVLIEAHLLSRCQFFLKCTSTVGEAVLWFNPDLEFVDLSYATATPAPR